MTRRTGKGRVEWRTGRRNWQWRGMEEVIGVGADNGRVKKEYSLEELIRRRRKIWKTAVREWKRSTRKENLDRREKPDER